MAFGSLAKHVSARLFLRRAQKLREDIASGALAGEDDLTKEEHDQYFATVQIVKAKCHYAENYIREAKQDRLHNAARQKLSGGMIMNVIRYVSMQAIARGETVLRLPDFRDGIRREYTKENRLE